MINKAQATLEFAVVFVITVALLMGMLSLWKWSSDRIVKRQISYNGSRLDAGKRSFDKPEGAAGGVPVIIKKGGPFLWDGPNFNNPNESGGNA